MSAAQRKVRQPDPPHTGWAPGMLQDDCRGLSRWLSNRPGARRQVRQVCAQLDALQPNHESPAISKPGCTGGGE